MHILIISQHYWPETVGTARRAQLLAEFLAARGHTVRVLCGRPNHPSMAGEFHTGHNGFEDHNGVDLHRLAVYRVTLKYSQTSAIPFTQNDMAGLNTSSSAGRTSPRLSRGARLHRWLTYGSWLARGALEIPVLSANWDVVLAISPLPTGLIGVLASVRLRVPFVFDLQDIWPDAALKAGILQNPGLVRVMEAAERWTYSHASALVVLSEGFGKNLEQKGVSSELIHVIPNSVDVRAHTDFARLDSRRALGIAPSDTLVMYTGNMGLVQDLDSLLEAAAGLNHVQDIKFLLVGDGVDRERLRRSAKQRGLGQIRFLNHQPAYRIPALLSAADVCFLSLRSGGYSAGTIPSKLYEYLAAGRPILNLVDGDVRRIIDLAEAGINVATGDVRALRVALFALHADPGLRGRMGAAARAFVEREAAISVVGNRYDTLLRRVSGQIQNPAADRPITDR